MSVAAATGAVLAIMGIGASRRVTLQTAAGRLRAAEPGEGLSYSNLLTLVRKRGKTAGAQVQHRAVPGHEAEVFRHFRTAPCATGGIHGCWRDAFPGDVAEFVAVALLPASRLRRAWSTAFASPATRPETRR